MIDDEQTIRTLILRWATAVHDGDLAGVIADHTTDVVMFDVPPPENGVRGIEAYQASWPSFFDWQAAGALFEIDSLEITAGGGVAFACALVRCGTPAELDRDPARRLRLTLGLRQEQGRWLVAHEHHSFTTTDVPAQVAADEVRAVHERWFDRTAAGDLDGLMEHIAPDVVSYEHTGPLSYVGIDEVREVCRHGLQNSPAPIMFDIPDLTVRSDGDLSVAWASTESPSTVARFCPAGPACSSDATGDWHMIHQHLSVPTETS